jgi:hypothetical protein
MATYYFHLCDGTGMLLDPDGRDLDTHAVASAALTEARAIVAADARSGHVYLDQTIEVHDRAGNIVHRVSFEDAVTVTHLAIRGE